MRSTFSIALILLVFSGSVGIPLYQHTCTHENITIHTLFTASDHCEEMQSQPVEKDECCAKAARQAAAEQVEKEPCCKEDVTRLAMTFNYFEHVQLSVGILPPAIPSIEQILPYTSVFPAEDAVLFASNSDPPPLPGRERLCLNCVYRL
jgi:hypothetical protein